MTAFARETLSTSQGNLTIELRTVNHRYLDFSFKIPERLRAAEGDLRKLATESLSRGKLDCLLRLQQGGAAAGGDGALVVDEARLDAVLNAVQQVAAKAGTTQALSPLEVLQFPGVCTTSEEGEEALLTAVVELFGKALGTLRDNRAREGSKLAVLILERLDQVATEVARIRERLPELLQQQRERVIARIADLDL
ncbi:MAG: YicC/YloC family endoribonuclease, partial [Parahaliea sp.]